MAQVRLSFSANPLVPGRKPCTPHSTSAPGPDTQRPAQERDGPPEAPGIQTPASPLRSPAPHAVPPGLYLRWPGAQVVAQGTTDLRPIPAFAPASKAKRPRLNCAPTYGAPKSG